MEQKWNVDFLLWYKDFLHLTLKCDFDLGGSTSIFALCTSFHSDHLCQIIFKKTAVKKLWIGHEDFLTFDLKVWPWPFE
jgi:hypothetical protein